MEIDFGRKPELEISVLSSSNNNTDYSKGPTHTYDNTMQVSCCTRMHFGGCTRESAGLYGVLSERDRRGIWFELEALRYQFIIECS